MADIELFEQHTYNVGTAIGVHSALLEFNPTTIINTWVALLILLVLVLLGRCALKKPDSLVYHMVISFVEGFMRFSEQTLSFFAYNYFLIAFSFFIFILLCNCIAIIPWTTEPTKDLNTTLAFGLIIFFYKDWQAIKVHGLKNFLKEFIHPSFVMLPINIIGHCSKVISISFRLFGNIFGGSVIMDLYRASIESSVITQILGILLGANFVVTIFFGIFEGLVQAAVFAMLSLTYIALELQKDDHG